MLKINAENMDYVNIVLTQTGGQVVYEKLIDGEHIQKVEKFVHEDQLTATDKKNICTAFGKLTGLTFIWEE